MAAPNGKPPRFSSSIAHKKDPIDGDVELKHELTPPGGHEPTFQERLRNPHLGKNKEQVISEAEQFAEEKGLQEHKELLVRGALLAWRPDQRDYLELDEYERECLRKEFSNVWKEKWDQTKMMYYVALLCGSAAIVQGMDQSVVNGAQIYYNDDFDITNEWQKGLINGAPYLCCVLIACWLSAPLNKYFGRRGTIWICCFVAIVSCIWQAVTFSKWQLFAARFFMGFAIGAKSSTTPAYAAECAPPKIRGALGTQWQMWTAFGIMMGNVMGVAFFNVTGLPGLNWRLMVASPAVPPIFVCIGTYYCPESPRWLMSKNRYGQAFKSLLALRKCKIQAARDLYDIHVRLSIEEAVKPHGFKKYTQLFSVPRNRRAAQSAGFLMFMQQFCGVNVIAYYSSEIFVNAGFTREIALVASLGAGAINWIGAIPGVLTIDSWGRRNLLLTTFPYMSACLFFTGFSFFIPETSRARVGCVATGIYLFEWGYSPGMGPVPFTYSAEAYPLAVRDVGMSLATAICWGFNFILALCWPAQVTAFREQGAFSWYAAWNLFGCAFTWFCLPETKERPLEELDAIFSVRTRDHAKYHLQKLPFMGFSKRHQDPEVRDVLEPEKQKQENGDYA